MITSAKQSDGNPWYLIFSWSKEQYHFLLTNTCTYLLIKHCLIRRITFIRTDYFYFTAAHIRSACCCHGVIVAFETNRFVDKADFPQYSFPSTRRKCFLTLKNYVILIETITVMWIEHRQWPPALKIVQPSNNETRVAWNIVRYCSLTLKHLMALC